MVQSNYANILERGVSDETRTGNMENAFDRGAVDLRRRFLPVSTCVFLGGDRYERYQRDHEYDGTTALSWACCLYHLDPHCKLFYLPYEMACDHKGYLSDDAVDDRYDRGRDIALRNPVDRVHCRRGYHGRTVDLPDCNKKTLVLFGRDTVCRGRIAAHPDLEYRNLNLYIKERPK